jgi:integrase
MRRKRYQAGSLRPRKRNGKTYWYAQWREDGNPKSRELGLVAKKRNTKGGMTESEAKIVLATIVAPLNSGRRKEGITFQEFVECHYLPSRREQNKRSTMMTTEPLIEKHLVEPLDTRMLNGITFDELQALLNSEAPTHTRSVVNQLKWQLRAMWRLAACKAFVDRDVALALYTPKKCKPGRLKPDLDRGDVLRLFAALELRERLISRLAIIEGARPGEILGSTWQGIGNKSFEVRQRIYRGDVDTPKTGKSIREGGLSLGTVRDLKKWRAMSRDATPGAWVFPSENPKSPISRDNVLRRNIRRKLETIGLGWVDFQIMRKANTNLSRDAKIDDKVSADQRGHGLGVSLERYARSKPAQKLAAVRKTRKVRL